VSLLRSTIENTPAVVAGLQGLVKQKANEHADCLQQMDRKMTIIKTDMEGLSISVMDMISAHRRFGRKAYRAVLQLITLLPDIGKMIQMYDYRGTLPVYFVY
jgi:hypothetical protein